uniref:Uncharacterized protein n=1 Tax=Siphoviridae sp. ctzyE57 TaxID=2827982 RepID=A0A8S5SGR3_9CAUD|nr:MAG TPA: hypothetical protein [Siphoviridae sp. ctzyE57]
MGKVTTPAAQVRTALKEAGYGAKAVTVRQKGRTDTLLEVAVRDSGVDLCAVERIARAVEHIDRDPSGDVLVGGNVAVICGYTGDVLSDVASRYQAVAVAALADYTSEYGQTLAQRADGRKLTWFARDGLLIADKGGSHEVDTFERSHWSAFADYIAAFVLTGALHAMAM